uniref:hypothetical protein n=1 Tax=Burkholderia diffusa TaxID=488732 RepID=UPI001CC5702F
MNFLQNLIRRANDPTVFGRSLYDTAPSGKPDIRRQLILFPRGITDLNAEIEFPWLILESGCPGGRTAGW